MNLRLIFAVVVVVVIIVVDVMLLVVILSVEETSEKRSSKHCSRTLIRQKTASESLTRLKYEVQELLIFTCWRD